MKIIKFYLKILKLIYVENVKFIIIILYLYSNRFIIFNLIKFIIYFINNN